MPQPIRMNARFCIFDDIFVNGPTQMNKQPLWFPYKNLSSFALMFCSFHLLLSLHQYHAYNMFSILINSINICSNVNLHSHTLYTFELQTFLEVNVAFDVNWNPIDSSMNQCLFEFKTKVKSCRHKLRFAITKFRRLGKYLMGKKKQQILLTAGDISHLLISI